MTKNLEREWLNREIEANAELANKAAEQANETSRLLSGQLILVAGTVITLTATFMASDSLVIGVKVLLASTWVAFAVSILSGVADILLTVHFFAGWQKFLYKSSVVLATTHDPSKIPEPPKQQSPQWALYSQLISLTVGVLIFMVLITTLLFAKS